MRTIDQLLGPHQFVGDADMDPRSRPLTSRPGGEIFAVAHHSVSRTLQAILGEFFSPNRSLSATSAIGPLSPGVDAYESRHCVPWNTHRPYTTSSWVDDQAITFEMANLHLGYPWPVGDTGLEWFAELVAAMHVQLGMPIDRWHVTCHSEIYQRGWGSYPTECCGTYMRNLLDWVCARAREIVAGGTVPPKTPEQIEEEELMAAKDEILSGVRREGRHRIFTSVSGLTALGKVGSVQPVLGRDRAEQITYLQAVTAAKPLVVTQPEIDSFVAGTIAPMQDTAFYGFVDLLLEEFGGVPEYGSFLRNTIDLKVGRTIMERSNGEFHYPTRQDVWADNREVECRFGDKLVVDFVNVGGVYTAMLVDGTAQVLTEAQVSSANAQRPAGQNWAVNA